jgi:hypothetical protein
MENVSIPDDIKKKFRTTVFDFVNEVTVIHLLILNNLVPLSLYAFADDLSVF